MNIVCSFLRACVGTRISLRPFPVFSHIDGSMRLPIFTARFFFANAADRNKYELFRFGGQKVSVYCSRSKRPEL